MTRADARLVADRHDPSAGGAAAKLLRMTGETLLDLVVAACPSPPRITGVACSTLAPLFAAVLAQDRHPFRMAQNEGEALALAAASFFSGCQPVCLLQNSGLGNLVNPMTSFVRASGLPALLVIGWRGRPGTPDEPQHVLMGALTPKLLSDMGVHVEELDGDPAEAVARFARLRAALVEDRPAALLVGNRALEREPGGASPSARGVGSGERLRLEILEEVLAHAPEHAVIVAGTGKCGRELVELRDRARTLYLVGAMGHAGAVGLGIALEQRDTPVIVLDGDGACLMHMGAMATIGRSRAGNLLHVVLDNASHDSTGGQPTASPDVDLCAVARACGYERVAASVDAGPLPGLLSRHDPLGPAFLRIAIAAGSRSTLGRPAVGPREVARRLRSSLGGPSPTRPLEMPDAEPR